jgi:hypothetical protein
MTINYPGPYEVRIFYTTTSSSVALQHIQHLSLALDTPLPEVGETFDNIIPIFRVPGGANLNLEDVVLDWATDFKAMLSSGGGNTLDRAELWKYEPESFDASFVSSYTLAIAGTSGSAIQAASQSIVTMRTQEGGIFKLSFMETVVAPAVTDSGTISNASLEALVAAIEGGQLFPWLARDTSYPISRIAHYPGQNEKLWKKRNRP